MCDRCINDRSGEYDMRMKLHRFCNLQLLTEVVYRADELVRPERYIVRVWADKVDCEQTDCSMVKTTTTRRRMHNLDADSI